MKPYECRFTDLRGDDLATCNAICDYAQKAYWEGIKKAFVWSPQFVQQSLRDASKIVAVDGDKIVGFLLMQFLRSSKPPMVKIQAVAPLHTLSENEQHCAVFSMFLFGRESCVEAGVQRGEGSIVSPNEPLLKTFALVKKYHIVPDGWFPDPLAASEAKIKRVSIEPINEGYWQALEDAIARL